MNKAKMGFLIFILSFGACLWLDTDKGSASGDTDYTQAIADLDEMRRICGDLIKVFERYQDGGILLPNGELMEFTTAQKQTLVDYYQDEKQNLVNLYNQLP